MYQIAFLYLNLYNGKILINQLENQLFPHSKKDTQKHDSHGVEAFNGDTKAQQCLSINRNSPLLDCIVINHIHRITNKTFVQWRLKW